MKTEARISGKRRRLRRRLIRITLAGILLLLLSVGTVSALGARARARLAEQNPPPGQMVDVGGYRLHLNCTGEGSPTVILEAGLRDFSVHWALVQPEVARFTRVCIYDRAGSGWSEASPYSRSSKTMVEELHTLLTNAGVEGPYILVGHSFGGMNVRLFAHHYPQKVAGMVLVDPMHEEQGSRLPTYREANKQVDRQFRLLGWLRTGGIIALGSEKVPEWGLPDEAFAQYAAILATTHYFETAVAESEALAQSWAEVQAEKISLGDLPLIVISRGLAEPIPGVSAAENEQNEQVWQEMQTELVALSKNGEQLIAAESGHNITLQQPELVVEAIRRIVPGSAAVQAPAHTSEVTGRPLLPPAATPTPEPTQTPTPEPAAADLQTEIAFTLRTEFAAGRMLFVGVGSDIDGIVSPDLVVPAGARVRVNLVNGDGILHDLFFPDFSAQSAAVGRKEQRTEVAFTVGAGKGGSYVYYCTFPGHREAGQEGQLIVSPAE